mmetsp:Transcript_10048/g.15433  ORF Transcript_10048/g.15433 Transcript_10048/m.15433 type:complete len:394 (-) Transcript_10048:264-1445(-)|eukprot:CAMPEP_0118696486 /NCGR_PEP_ID=MMETSP0800-20121206/13873_1 /TAXON_ID=210618 ORGANISM="Striatella unipunctata, Strain CCMP2910" /NCGR_SAMPLE_ID=MMETSP0800 /ASSEMBLY_ACC=CAM_ASM_000638 /LENGTH=393 /DNA_ID=CAMNT_0006595603 /DNA_START=96 /DNA_END=1277 /DNA_ORIENTATION=+
MNGPASSFRTNSWSLLLLLLTVAVAVSTASDVVRQDKIDVMQNRIDSISSRVSKLKTKLEEARGKFEENRLRLISNKLDRVHRLSRDFDGKTADLKLTCPNKVKQENQDACWDRYQTYKERIYSRMEDATEDMKVAARGLVETSKDRLTDFLGKFVDLQLKTEKHLDTVNDWIQKLTADTTGSSTAAAQMTQAQNQATALKDMARTIAILDDQANKLLLSFEANNKYGQMCFRFKGTSTYIDIHNEDTVKLVELTLKMGIELLLASHGDGGDVNSVTLSDQIFTPDPGFLRRNLESDTERAIKLGVSIMRSVLGIDCSNCEDDDPSSDAYARRQLSEEASEQQQQSRDLMATEGVETWDPKVLEMLTLSMQRTFPEIMGEVSETTVVSCDVFE